MLSKTTIPSTDSLMLSDICSREESHLQDALLLKACRFLETSIDDINEIKNDVKHLVENPSQSQVATSTLPVNPDEVCDKLTSLESHPLYYLLSKACEPSLDILPQTTIPAKDALAFSSHCDEFSDLNDPLLAQACTFLISSLEDNQRIKSQTTSPPLPRISADLDSRSSFLDRCSEISDYSADPLYPLLQHSCTLLSESTISNAIPNNEQTPQGLLSEDQIPEIVEFAKTIFIFTTTYNRPVLLNLMASSLHNVHYIEHCHLFVLDDNSTAYGVEELQFWFPTAEIIREEYNETDLIGWDDHHADRKNYFEHVMFMERSENIKDAIFIDLPDDVSVSYDMITRLYSSLITDGLLHEKVQLTLYNSALKPDAEPKDSTPPHGVTYLHAKRNVGFTGLLVTRTILKLWFERIEQNGGPYHKYDLNFSSFVGKADGGYKKFAFEPSVVQHTGAWSGTHPNRGEIVKGFQSKLSAAEFTALVMLGAAQAMELKLDLNCDAFTHPTTPNDYTLLSAETVKTCCHDCVF